MLRSQERERPTSARLLCKAAGFRRRAIHWVTDREWVALGATYTTTVSLGQVAALRGWSGDAADPPDEEESTREREPGRILPIVREDYTRTHGGAAQ